MRPGDLLWWPAGVYRLARHVSGRRRARPSLAIATRSAGLAARLSPLRGARHQTRDRSARPRTLP